MAKIIINGEVCSGSSSYASAVEYIKDDGIKSTVQNELDELNSNLPYKIWQVIVPIDVNIEGMKEIPYPTGCSIINTNFLTFTVMYDTHIQHITPTTPNLLDVQLLKDKIRIYVKSELVVGKQATLFFMSNVN